MTSWTLAANFGSLDSLKVRTRCGCRPCAAQIRCTLRRLTPAALAIARPVPCVASPGGPASVIATTCSIVAAGSGFLRPGRVASCSSPATPLAMTAPATHASAGCSPIRSRLPAVRGRPDQAGLQCLSSSAQARTSASPWESFVSVHPLDLIVEILGFGRRGLFEDHNEACAGGSKQLMPSPSLLADATGSSRWGADAEEFVRLDRGHFSDFLISMSALRLNYVQQSRPADGMFFIETDYD